MILWVLLFIAVCVGALVVLVFLARQGLRAIATFKEVGGDLGLSFTKSSRESGQMPSLSGTVDGVPVRATLEREPAGADNPQRGLYVTLRAEVTIAEADTERRRAATSELDQRFDACTISAEEIVAERWNTALEPAELRGDLHHVAAAAATLDTNSD